MQRAFLPKKNASSRALPKAHSRVTAANKQGGLSIHKQVVRDEINGLVKKRINNIQIIRVRKYREIVRLVLLHNLKFYLKGEKTQTV